MTDVPKRLSTKEAAEYIGRQRSTLAKWRVEGIGPPYHRCGSRMVQYLRNELDAWLAECDQLRPAKRAAELDGR